MPVEGVSEIVYGLSGFGLRTDGDRRKGYLPDGGGTSGETYQDGGGVPLFPRLYNQIHTYVERYAE